jgi:hypothetical protein
MSIFAVSVIILSFLCYMWHGIRVDSRAARVGVSMGYCARNAFARIDIICLSDSLYYTERLCISANKLHSTNNTSPLQKMMELYVTSLYSWLMGLLCGIYAQPRQTPMLCYMYIYPVPNPTSKFRNHPIVCPFRGIIYSPYLFFPHNTIFQSQYILP